MTLLLGVLAALMLVPAAQAVAGTATMVVHATGSGSGEVSSVEGYVGEPAHMIGEPPIECAYNGASTSGVCQNEVDFWGGPEWAGDALTETPAAGSEFLGWSVTFVGNGPFGHKITGCDLEGNCTPGSCPSTKAQCVALYFAESASELEGDTIEVTAQFASTAPAGPPLTLNIEEGEGTVVSNPAGLTCTGAAPHSCTTEAIAEGSVVLTASPASGYLLKSWKGCGTVNGRQCTVSLTGAKTVGAKFVRAFNLSVSKAGAGLGGLGGLTTSPGGVNCPSNCNTSTALYKEGTVTVKATPAKHFHLVQFTGGSGSAAACNGLTSCSFEITAGSTVQAEFKEDAKRILTLGKKGGGQATITTKPAGVSCGLTCQGAQAEFYEGEPIAITVVLGKGTEAVEWTAAGNPGTCTGNALSCTVSLVSGGLTLEANLK